MERIWQEDVVEYVAVTRYSLIYPESQYNYENNRIAVLWT
jgi:hypothetical protein